jgi:uncharacterized protein YecT (DUF1311 family)
MLKQRPQISITYTVVCMLLSATTAISASADDARKEELAAYDKELNITYSRLLQTIEPNKKEKLKAAQRLWLQVRNADCEWAYINPLDCMRARTISRTDELKSSEYRDAKGKVTSLEDSKSSR